MEKINELPSPVDFMKLGEDAFIKNVHEKLRETLSPTEKQMWINGYLLALTQQKRNYSEEDIALAFNEGQAYSVTGKLVDGKEWVKEHKKEWFEQFKNK
jgi:hypothetical protein